MMIKKSPEYWLKGVPLEESIGYLQHLISQEKMAKEQKANRKPTKSDSPLKQDQNTGSAAQGNDPEGMLTSGKPHPYLEPNGVSDLQDDERMERPDGQENFENLLPIINSSASSTDYLQYIFSFITTNLTDLSAITSILDLSKFSQPKRTRLVDDFSLDSNMMEVVKRVNHFKQEIARSAAASSLNKRSGSLNSEDGGQQTGRSSHSSGSDHAAFALETQGIYKLVPGEYFSANFQPDMTDLLQAAQLEAKIGYLQELHQAVQENRICELTDKFDVFLEIMQRLGEMDTTIKQQMELIQTLR